MLGPWIDTDTDANMQMRMNEGFWGTSGGHYIASELGAAAVLAGGAGLLDISPTDLAQKMGLTSGALLEQWPLEWMQEPSKPPRVVTADICRSHPVCWNSCKLQQPIFYDS